MGGGGSRLGCECRVEVGGFGGGQWCCVVVCGWIGRVYGGVRGVFAVVAGFLVGFAVIWWWPRWCVFFFLALRTTVVCCVAFGGWFLVLYFLYSKGVLF